MQRRKNFGGCLGIKWDLSCHGLFNQIIGSPKIRFRRTINFPASRRGEMPAAYCTLFARRSHRPIAQCLIKSMQERMNTLTRNEAVKFGKRFKETRLRNNYDRKSFIP